MVATTQTVEESENISDCPIQVFEIYLKTDLFFPGEVISGKVLTLTDRKMETKGIYLKFEGKAGAKWETRSSHFCGLHEAEYVEGKKSLFAKVFRYDENKIPEGSSALPFEFELPLEIPPTIDSLDSMKYFRVSYYIEALIRTSDADYRQRKSFTVKGLLNLNRFPELSLPVCKTSRETIFESCWSSTGKTVSLNFSLQKQGFVPGEKLVADLFAKSLSGTSENDKNTLISMLANVEMCLVQEITVKIDGNSIIRRRIVAKNDVMHASSLKTLTAAGNQKNHFERKVCLGLKIPEEVFISYENSGESQDFLTIKYFIRVTVEQISFPYKFIRLQIPITIGTVWIQARKTIPILLLASVPFVLPRPDITSSDPFKTREEYDIKGNPDDSSFLPLSTAMALLPKFFLNSSVTVDLDRDINESIFNQEKQSHSLPV